MVILVTAASCCLPYLPPGGCTLIFTTHHLDEAEVLSDRIAILQQGQLRCCGSPSYLRETYGQGHSLTLIKKPPSVFEIHDPVHVVRVTSLVQTHIPEAFLKENSGTELTYVIPERADKTSFKGLFQALDQSLHHLHVTGYGISDTTLEEVFSVFLCNRIFLLDNLVFASSCSLLYLSNFTTVSCEKHVKKQTNKQTKKSNTKLWWFYRARQLNTTTALSLPLLR
uniref:ATP binding cassette subfamily A member 13 n=1 Tax=Anser brachyrhynchus TaxID=132585 RepID=A0A8B9IC28_9AVES